MRKNRKRPTRKQKMVAGSKPSGKSRYGRKRIYLDRLGGWGFDYFEPKPWK